MECELSEQAFSYALARRLGMLFLLVYTRLQTSVNLKNRLRPFCSNEHSLLLPCCFVVTVVLFSFVVFLCFTVHCSAPLNSTVEPRYMCVHIYIVIVIVIERMTETACEAVTRFHIRTLHLIVSGLLTIPR